MNEENEMFYSLEKCQEQNLQIQQLEEKVRQPIDKGKRQCQL
jgi:hypothetical protein